MATQMLYDMIRFALGGGNMETLGVVAGASADKMRRTSFAQMGRPS